MTAESEPEPRVTSVDHVLSAWRQGDCVLGEHWFAHRLDKSFAVTDAGRVAAEADADLAEQQVLGLVVVKQTCDVVRSCTERPYVEVCPLVEVDDGRLREIQRGRRPSYAFVPLVAERKLAADLDRVMTVEKPLVATWERTPGWTTDAEARAFALVESWFKLAPESGRFTKIYGQVTTLEDLRAADYVDSDPLDLDHLSSRDDE